MGGREGGREEGGGGRGRGGGREGEREGGRETHLCQFLPELEDLLVELGDGLLALWRGYPIDRGGVHATHDL